MEDIVSTTLFIHASAGGLALISGIMAIFSKKGKKKHIISGNIYFWSMLVVIISGLIVGWYRNNLFLQAIAVFSFYMAFTGKRLLRYKVKINPQPIDWFVNAVAIGVAMAMLYFSIKIMLKAGFAGPAPMLLVFGSILLAMSGGDLLKMIGKKLVSNAWLYDHIGRMGGSFIATVTAFLVVNIHFDPGWVLWFLPTAIGTPMIIGAIVLWRKKLEGKKRI